jgi:histidinol dehydrogenase
LEIIRGYQAARARLNRQPSIGGDDLPLNIKARLKNIFGKEISAEEAVRQILSDVKAEGDKAIFDYTFRIDGVHLSSLEVSRSEIKNAYRHVDKKLLDSLRLAGERIGEFHQAQKDRMWHEVVGKEWGQQIRAITRVGVYAPGGTASYPSTVLMVAIPAKVAGVKEVILVTPPRSQGDLLPATLVAADIAGVDRVFAVGGAQAIGALAYGTQSVPRVDKICGPGNLFVTLAKKAVFGNVGIDALQGPSEVLVIADSSADAGYVAADLLAQAEHDAMAQVVLVTTSVKLAQRVEKEIVCQLASLSRDKIASASLEKRGVIAVVNSLNQAVELANCYAPEHLELTVKNPETWLKKIENAGCIFLGEN